MHTFICRRCRHFRTLTPSITVTIKWLFEKGRHTSYDFTYIAPVIDSVNYFKYLGVTLYKNGNWYRTQKVIAEHSSFALHNLFITFNQIELTAKDKCKLFDTLVGSILNYGAENFGYHTCKSIENIHCKFLRKLLCVQRSTNLGCLYGEVGRYPMILHRKLVMIKFWINILKLNNDSLVKKT